MKARVLEEQADCFEVAVLSLTAEVQPVSAEQLLAIPSGPPVVVVGGLFCGRATRRYAQALGGACPCGHFSARCAPVRRR